MSMLSLDTAAATKIVFQRPVKPIKYVIFQLEIHQLL